MQIDELAQKMEDGFKKIDQKMDERFEKMEGRFKRMDEKMDKGFEAVRSEIHEVLEVVNEHSTRMDARLDDIDGRLGTLTKTVANFPTKEYVDDKIGALRGEVVTIAREAALSAVAAK